MVAVCGVVPVAAVVPIKSIFTDENNLQHGNVRSSACCRCDPISLEDDLFQRFLFRLYLY